MALEQQTIALIGIGVTVVAVGIAIGGLIATLHGDTRTDFRDRFAILEKGMDRFDTSLKDVNKRLRTVEVVLQIRPTKSDIGPAGALSSCALSPATMATATIPDCTNMAPADKPLADPPPRL